MEPSRNPTAIKVNELLILKQNVEMARFGNDAREMRTQRG